MPEDATTDPRPAPVPEVEPGPQPEAGAGPQPEAGQRSEAEPAPDPGEGPKASGTVTTLLRDPIEGAKQGAKQVIEVLQARRGIAIGWAVCLILTILCYLIDLGAGSLWNGDDALVALALKGLLNHRLSVAEASRLIPPPTGAPLALWEMAA